jgi:hypothetical protein
VSGRGFSCYFKDLCAEFDPVRQPLASDAGWRGAVAADAALYGHLNEKF